MLAAVTRFGKARSRKSIYGTGSGKFKRVAILLPLIFLATVSELFFLFGDDSSHQQDGQSPWSLHGRPLSRSDGFRRRLHSVADGSGSFGASTPGTHHPVDALYIWPDVALRATSLAQNSEPFPGAEILRYSLRSLETYAPWINRVFIVVPDPMAKIPTWLDESNPKLKVIQLESTATIDQLPQISEHFLFFAEPYVLVQDVTLADFASPEGVIMVRYGRAVTEPEVVAAVQRRYPFVSPSKLNYTAGSPFLVTKYALKEIPGTVALSHPLLPLFYATHTVHVRQNLLLLDAIRSGKILRSHLMESCHASELSSESRCYCRENPRLLELCICRQSGWLPVEVCSPYHAAVQECRQSSTEASPNRCKLLKDQQESCPTVFRNTQNCSLSMAKYKTFTHPEDSATTSVAEVADDHVQFQGIMWRYLLKRSRFLTVRQDTLAGHAEFVAAFTEAMNERYSAPSQFEIR